MPNANITGSAALPIDVTDRITKARGTTNATRVQLVVLAYESGAVRPGG